MADTVTLKLSRPIDAHGEKVSELEFHELTGKDVIRAGLPYMIEERAGLGSLTHFDAAAVANLISTSARIPPSSVGALTPADLMKAMGIILSFFETPDAPPKSGELTSASAASITT